MTRLHNLDPNRIRSFTETTENGRTTLCYRCDASVAYGMGERFDGVDRMGKTTECAMSKIYAPGRADIFPAAVFFCDDGHGVFVNTDAAPVFQLEHGRIAITLPDESEVFFFYGTPREIVSRFVAMTGEPAFHRRGRWPVDFRKPMETAGGRGGATAKADRHAVSRHCSRRRGLERRGDLLYLERRGLR